MILCFNKAEKAVRQLFSDIKAETAKTPYSCAIGMAYLEGEQEFDKLCSQADQEMYEDKFRMKNPSGISVRNF